MTMTDPLLAEARQILIDNDRGGYTVPTARLYPYQWNWDSAFAALGFATFDRDRAWRELEMLIAGQWADGMVPHIIFYKNDPDYFPGPDFWQSGTEPPSSGISQPPVMTTIALRLFQSGGEDDRKRAVAMFDALLAYHRWFHAARDPDGTGLVSIVHPWESGRDNCPDWDIGMDAVVVAEDLGEYHRRDTGHVDASERPTSEQYDRYLTIVKFGRDCGWDHQEIYRNGPFLMADPCVHFLLMAADRDLLTMAKLFGKTDCLAEIEGWLAAYERGNALLWNEDVQCFCARDTRTGAFSDGITNASVLALFAGAGTDTQRAKVVEHARAIMDASHAGFPSWDPRHPAYESQRYWRGPVWTMLNYLIAEGFDANGAPDLGMKLRQQTLDLVRTAGFYEYFDSRTGAGCGGGRFTWTAAIHLVLEAEAQNAAAA